jgi:two-component system sensor histidine kinase AlgZ
VARQRADWLPDFCSASTVVAMWIMASAVLLVVHLAPADSGQGTLRGLSVGMLFLFSVTTLGVLTLCALRPHLVTLPDHTVVIATYAVVLSVTAGGSLASHWIDHALALGATVDKVRGAEFVLRNMLLVAIVWGVALRHFYVRGQWREQVRAHAAAQVDALQARIRPHFLFNSMNTIASLVHQRPADAEKAVEDLSELFRAALKAGNDSTLEMELALVRRYLDIEKLRLGRRLEWVEDTKSAPLSLSMPALLLQPLVENAILHGIQQLESGGRITLMAETEGAFVTISVHNPCPAEPSRNHQGAGMALDNIRQRVLHHYGDLARVEVQQLNEQFTVRLVLPWR